MGVYRTHWQQDYLILPLVGSQGSLWSIVEYCSGVGLRGSVCLVILSFFICCTTVVAATLCMCVYVCVCVCMYVCVSVMYRCAVGGLVVLNYCSEFIDIHAYGHLCVTVCDQ